MKMTLKPEKMTTCHVWTANLRVLLTFILLAFSCTETQAQNIFALPEKAPPTSGFILSTPLDPNASPLYKPVPLDTKTADKGLLVSKFFTDCNNRNDGGFSDQEQEMPVNGAQFDA